MSAKLDVDARRTRALERWFERHQRDLPWRRDRRAYTALVSEAMLQQTQVARVNERFPAFMRRFPSIRALARADEQEVLAAWAGLGYYRRARHLHAAAKMIVDEFKGRMPRTPDGLARLPGVGRYTAGAIASIVFGEATPIVDGNVMRVLARWDANDAPPKAPETVATMWRRAGELVRVADRPGVFNEALMELGATVCTPARPRCDACPVAAECTARRRNAVDRIPPPRPGAKTRDVHHHAVLIRRRDHVYLEQRPAQGLWSRMWQAPTIESPRPLPLVEIVRALPLNVAGVSSAGSFEHRTTHRRIRFHVFHARSRARRGVWRRLDDVADLPMSNAQRRVLAWGEA